jgi:hypothetical protein
MSHQLETLQMLGTGPSMTEERLKDFVSSLSPPSGGLFCVHLPIGI